MKKPSHLRCTVGNQRGHSHVSTQKQELPQAVAVASAQEAFLVMYVKACKWVITAVILPIIVGAAGSVIAVILLAYFHLV